MPLLRLKKCKVRSVLLEPRERHRNREEDRKGSSLAVPGTGSLAKIQKKGVGKKGQRVAPGLCQDLALDVGVKDHFWLSAGPAHFPRASKEKVRSVQGKKYFDQAAPWHHTDSSRWTGSDFST